jgi:hypothetical protein
LIMATGANRPSRGGQADKEATRDQKHHSDSHKLDEALEESFPGSDAPSVTQPTRKDTPDKREQQE